MAGCSQQVIISSKWEEDELVLGVGGPHFRKNFWAHCIYPFQEHFVVCTKCDQDQWPEKSLYKELEQGRATSQVCFFPVRPNASQIPDKPSASHLEANWPDLFSGINPHFWFYII